MPLGTEVGLAPGHTVLDGDRAPSRPKGAQQPPSFRPMSVVAKRSPILVTAQLLLFYMILLSSITSIIGLTPACRRSSNEAFRKNRSFDSHDQSLYVWLLVRPVHTSIGA